MKPKYMLDTNICIYLMKHQPPQVRARFADFFVGDVVISAITLAELKYGVACSGAAQAHNQMLLESLLEDIPVAPFEAHAASAAGYALAHGFNTSNLFLCHCEERSHAAVQCGGRSGDDAFARSRCWMATLRSP